LQAFLLFKNDFKSRQEWVVKNIMEEFLNCISYIFEMNKHKFKVKFLTIEKLNFKRFPDKNTKFQRNTDNFKDGQRSLKSEISTLID
jgi:hypothetical protein